ncbi:MAG: hypothetical protein Q8R28_01545, partial [Dehalococcoidia bacterium]|nr:hypothetical protein [Dehalococcoidia bacterium]
MKAFINRDLITQTGVDSGALTMLGSVVRNFPEPGEYLGTVFQGDREGARFQLAVDKESAAMQVDIDLANLSAAPREECPCKEGSGGGLRRFVVNPKGYVVFHVSRGPGGYAVRVAGVAGEHQGKPFDSRELQEGDLFAVTLIRPGAYSVSNLSNKARGEIVVAYPKAGKAPF